MKQANLDAESGLLISAMVDSVPCDILVDTGATSTIIADKLYDQIERKSSL